MDRALEDSHLRLSVVSVFFLSCVQKEPDEKESELLKLHGPGLSLRKTLVTDLFLFVSFWRRISLTFWFSRC